jgi:uncharacterized protein YjbI with pentapeptide repeats
MSRFPNNRKGPMDNQALCALMLLCSICWATGARGDVLRWDTNTVIPGTENIEPGPGVQLDHRELSHALLSDLDLTGANFKLSNLRSARVRSSVLDNANFSGANLTFAFLDSQLTQVKDFCRSGKDLGSI